ncbi:hypothetical protein EVAR_43869_1 [Eumeta japonica]|uniref:Uncharacterized protein n=1 Tax=Eumeta variegata TaxID=151549 RepID=A0A4C1X1C6_EUMVA|nr:hypothetical protein EVAR_43869_1 [Eumeta japonica]
MGGGDRRLSDAARKRYEKGAEWSRTSPSVGLYADPALMIIVSIKPLNRSGGFTHCEAPGGRSLRGPLSYRKVPM